MKKIAGILVLLATVAPLPAQAGLETDIPVTVDTQARFARGSLSSAHNSKDKVQFIGCGLGGGNLGHYSGACWARDADGNYGSCNFQDNLGMALALAGINSDSYVRFEWNEANVCVGISVQTLSTQSPKQ